MLYLNYAGLSPTRTEAAEAMQAASSEFHTLLFSESGIHWYRKQVEDCRKKVARFLRVQPDKDSHSLVFASNSSTAYKIALSTLALQPGDVVITSDQEHPSTLQTLQALQQRGIELTIIPAPSEEAFLVQLENVCRAGHARLITLSHVAHTDGRIFPIQQVCDIAGRRDVVVAIDGAQAVGHVPVDLGTLAVDFYFFSGHKWCAGPMGTGALLITEQYKKRHARHEPGLVENIRAQKYLDLGTQNIGLISGLAKACEMRQEEWPAMAGLGDLRTLLKARLSRMRGLDIVEWDGPHAPGILSFRVDKAGLDTTQIAEYLFSKHGVAIKPISSPELPRMLRVSWSLSTNADEISFLAETLDEALAFLG